MKDHERVILIRKALGFDQWEEFAKKLGYTNKYSYRNIETGRDRLGMNVKLRLNQTFNVNMEFLNGVTDDLDKMFEKNEVLETNTVNDIPILNFEEMSSKLILQNEHLLEIIKRHSIILEKYTIIIENLSNDVNHMKHCKQNDQ